MAIHTRSYGKHQCRSALCIDTVDIRSFHQQLGRWSDDDDDGWGIWGRNHILDDVTGQILTVTDGRWIVQIGTFGWLGFLAEFLLLAAPIAVLWWRVLKGDGSNLSPFVGALAVMLGVNMVDLIPNATLTPVTWLLAGAVLGYAERYQPARRVQPSALQTVI